MTLENIDKFIYDNNIKTDDLGNVYIQISDGNLIFNPIDDFNLCTVVDKTTFLNILNGTLKYNTKTKTFVPFKTFAQERTRIEELKKALSDTDYLAIKYAEGELSEDEYASTKFLRRRWRIEINELEGIINDG